MRPRLACRRTGFVLLLGLLPLVEACLLFSPLDEVSEGGADDVVGDGSYGGSGAGNGGTANTGSGGTSSPGASGRMETGNGGNIGLSGSSGNGGTAGTGGTTSAPSDVSSWCPDPVALFARNNPYIASFTPVDGDCGELMDIEYNAGGEAAPSCTLMTAPLPSEFCGYEEVEICFGLTVDAETTADTESHVVLLQLEPGGLIGGSAEVALDFYRGGDTVSCFGTYEVIFTPQLEQ